jgi:parallel beta-helix repeat protein
VLDGNGFALTKPAVNTEGLMMPIGWLPGVRVVGMNNVAITNIVFEGCITGVTVENSSSITISRNTIRETTGGIVVLSSLEINIIGNNIALSDQSFATGIHFLPSNPEASNPHHIKIEGNQISGNSNQVPTIPPQPEQYGICGGFSDSQMTGNNLANIKGIALYYTGSNNLIAGNNFQDNYEGILFSGYSQLSVNNTIYGNNFNHNSENVVVPFIRDPPINFWDNGTVGNYWSDYQTKYPDATEVDNSGIADTPYTVDENNADNYPLITPVTITLTPFTIPEPSPFDTPLKTVAFVATVATLFVVAFFIYKKYRRN